MRRLTREQVVAAARLRAERPLWHGLSEPHKVVPPPSLWGLVWDLLGLIALFAVLLLVGCRGAEGPIALPTLGALPGAEAGREAIICSRNPLVVVYCEDGVPCRCPPKVADFIWEDRQ